MISSGTYHSHTFAFPVLDPMFSDSLRRVSLSLSQFLTLLLSDIFRRVSEKNAEDTIANTAFRLFDLDRDGFVTKEEFKQVSCYCCL